MSRRAELHRKTTETDVRLSLDLDGGGRPDVRTGVGFFDHMLTLLAKHALFDLDVTAEGDLHVDAHHTVEDVGLSLGSALADALGDKAGVRRYGEARVPMDEVLVAVAVDLSGRPFCRAGLAFDSPRVGDFDTELVVEFLRAVANAGRLTLHADLIAAGNGHHVAEATFKALGRALRGACELDPRGGGAVPSTKGTL